MGAKDRDNLGNTTLGDIPGHIQRAEYGFHGILATESAKGLRCGKPDEKKLIPEGVHQVGKRIVIAQITERLNGP
jgi:hypothetical protein